MQSESETTSLSLLERARQNDRQAWERLVRLYGPEVYRLCRVSQLQASDASDIVQEVFRAVAGHLHRFHHDQPGDTFQGWLLTITRNKIRDHFKARAHRERAAGGTDMQQLLRQLPDLDWSSSTEAGYVDSRANVMHRVVELVRGDFHQKTWLSFWLTTIEGREVEEVGRDLGLSKWAVYQAKSRVLRRIREELDGLIE